MNNHLPFVSPFVLGPSKEKVRYVHDRTCINHGFPIMNITDHCPSCKKMLSSKKFLKNT